MLNCWSQGLRLKNLNSDLISQSGVYVTHKLLVVHLKISLEDDSLLLPVKPAPLGGSRGINTSFHLILACRKRGKVRGDLSLAHHHMCLCLPSLASGTDYHHIPASYCYSPPLRLVFHARSWLACQETLPTFPSIFMQPKPRFTLLIKIYRKSKEPLKGFPAKIYNNNGELEAIYGA